MATSSLDFFRQDTAKGSLTPSYGPLSGPGAARASGRSWMDPNRALERKARLEDRMLRREAAGGGGGGGRAVQQSPLAPLPEGVAQTNATTGQITTILPPTETGEGLGAYNRKVYERLGVRFEPQVGVYDPRTGLSQTLTPQQAMQRGLLGAAQRALLEGLNRGQTFSRTNPFV